MKIFSILKLENLKNNIKNVFTRFPVSSIIILIITGIFLGSNHLDLSINLNELLIRINISLIITFFLSIGLYLFNESSNKKNIDSLIYQIGAIIFGVFFFIGFDQNLDNIENIIFFMITLVGIISFLFFAPYAKNIINDKVKHNIYYTYFYNISVVFLTSFILGLVLFILGNIGVAAVFQLFDLDWLNHGKIIGDWAIISLSLITPIFALSNLPSKKSFSENHFNENVFFSFLVKYIAIPFIYIYFIILYAYTIKVLSNFGEWPKGEVSWMVIGFSVFGFLTYIYSYIFEEKNKFISIFRKAFPYVVIPQIFMLFYAIYLRVAQYDLTINRYFIIVFGLWLLIISIYYIISKEKKLSIIVSSLTLFTIIISVGPWSVYNLPETRQQNILESNLKEAGILKDGKIIPLKNINDIEEKLSENIYSEIDYLCDYSDCKSIKEIFKVQYTELVEKDNEKWEENREKNIKRYEEAIVKYAESDKQRVKNNEKILKRTQEENYEGPSKWEIVDYITETIKVERSYGSSNRINSTIYFNIKGENSIYPINIEGYKTLLSFNSYNNSNGESKIDIENEIIEINHNSEINKIDIKTIFVQLTKMHNDGKRDFKKEDLTFEIDGYKIIIENISIENPEYKGDSQIYTHGSGYILVK